MKTKGFIVVTLLILVLVSCKNNSKETDLETKTIQHSKTVPAKNAYRPAETKVTFKDPKVADIYHDYILLKTTLVNTDPEGSSKAAMDLVAAFTAIGVEDEVLVATQAITDFNDIEAHRKSFVMITAAVEKMLEDQIESGTIYKQYCPMAFDFEGAFWLSNSNEIYNPYFGNKMLRCGKVDSEIQ